MAEPKTPKPDDKKRTVLCPECEREVVLEDGEGVCDNCGLDVGLVLKRHRTNKAVRKLEERESAENPPVPKKKGWGHIEI